MEAEAYFHLKMVLGYKATDEHDDEYSSCRLETRHSCTELVAE